MKIDLSQFRQTYLQESAELVESMESGLLALRSAPADAELLHSIFRCAHSIKGGAGTFGFSSLARFTHALEGLLDCLRSLEIIATPQVIDLLLRAVDALRAMLGAGGDNASGDSLPADASQVMEEIEILVAAAARASASFIEHNGELASPAEPAVHQAANNQALYRVEFRPRRDLFVSGANPILLLRNLAEFGSVSVCQVHAEDLPPLQQLDPLQCYLRWTVELASTQPEEALREVFEFVEHLADIEIQRLQAPPAIQPPVHRPPTGQPPLDDAAERKIPGKGQPGKVLNAKKPAHLAEAASIRVATDKVDRLIDLVGELVIAQVMTAQMVENFEPSRLAKLRDAVTAMERSTRELHERVMAVRMMPVGALFQRYVRVVYDIAQSTGKQIRLETVGEDIEIDKSMLEQLGDPLTHLVRNAADHGIEGIADRLAAGKPAEGVISLRAMHRGGRIVLEVSDDGAGIDAVRVRAKAIESNLMSPEALLDEEQIRMLIFEPGFSTREAVSELSGRGVGMDVVKRNVQQLSGTVGLTSVPGQGSTVSIELPLTLAILEGLLVGVADRVLVLPLLVVVEAVSLQTNRIQQVADQGEIIVIRQEPIPILRLNRFLEIQSPVFAGTGPDLRLVVVVAAGRRKIGLVIDELLGQQQVVVKSLERHLHKVEGLMGATILGDGRVAPILDVTALAALDLFSIVAHAGPKGVKLHELV